jgi:fatty-acid desaturase
MFDNLDFKNLYSWKLFFIHLLAYASIPYLIVNGSWQNVAVILFMHMVLATNMSITYHRYLSHKSFEFKHPLVKSICLWMAHLTAFSSGITWTSIHREHHRFVDTPNDPHSCFGLKDAIRIHFLFYWIQPKVKYGIDLFRNSECLWLHKHYFKLNYALLILLFVLFGPVWTASIYLIPSLMVYHGSSFVNTLSHKFGYRNHDSKDLSTNNLFVGYITYGEWHNNHHAHPERSRYGVLKHELDLAHMVIRRIAKIGR